MLRIILLYVRENHLHDRRGGRNSSHAQPGKMAEMSKLLQRLEAGLMQLAK
jgi:hypothetical protein